MVNVLQRLLFKANNIVLQIKKAIVMQWHFIDSDIITDSDTGYTIRLNAGTWREPLDITPDKASLTACDQARLLRLGLEFAKESLTTKIAC
jgi:hypothetical protein